MFGRRASAALALEAKKIAANARRVQGFMA